ncbi:hypothetical protein [Aquimarina sp. SS2-1]|uniref:hypothetical protein n=1 Tax=Aquimarina besae TaxID=3342247 RepID=UPI00366E8FF6
MSKKGKSKSSIKNIKLKVSNITKDNKGLGVGSRGIRSKPKKQISISHETKPKKWSSLGYDTHNDNQIKTSVNELANQLSLMLYRMAEVIEVNIPKKSIPVVYKSLPVPIDKSFEWIEKPGRELSIRFFKLVLFQFNITLTRYSLISLYNACNWTLYIDDTDLRKKIKNLLENEETTIEYSTKDFPKLQKCYRAWLKKESKRLREAAAWALSQREKSSLFVVDFYIAHYNGLIGVTEGLSEVGLLLPNIVGKIRGKDWTHVRFEKARLDYKTPWGKRNATYMEAGAGLGLTGPLLAITKSQALISTMEKVGKTLRLSPHVATSIKALLIGKEIADTVETSYVIQRALSIINSGNITINGKTRTATEEEINAAWESLFLLGVGKITSSSMAKSARSMADNLGHKVLTPEQVLIKELNSPLNFGKRGKNNEKKHSETGARSTSSKGTNSSKSTEPNQQGTISTLTPERKIINKKVRLLKKSIRQQTEKVINKKKLREIAGKKRLAALGNYNNTKKLTSKEKALVRKHKKSMRDYEKSVSDLDRLKNEYKKYEQQIRKKKSKGQRGLEEEAIRLSELPDFNGLPTGIKAMDYVAKSKGSDGSLTFRQHFFTENKKVINALKIGNVDNVSRQIKNTCITPKLQNFNSNAFADFGSFWNNNKRENGKTFKEQYNFEFPEKRSDSSLKFELDIGIAAPKPENWAQIFAKIKAEFVSNTHPNAKIYIYFKPDE